MPVTTAATQIETEGAARLKRTCSDRSPRPSRDSFRHKTRESRATSTVPTAGPRRTVPARTNVSDMEMVARPEGSLTDSQPLMRVSPASFSQSSCQAQGLPVSSRMLSPITTSPEATTRLTYTSVLVENVRLRGSAIGKCRPAPAEYQGADQRLYRSEMVEAPASGMARGSEGLLDASPRL